MNTSAKHSKILARQARRRNYYIIEKKRLEEKTKAQKEFSRKACLSENSKRWTANTLRTQARKM